MTPALPRPLALAVLAALAAGCQRPEPTVREEAGRLDLGAAESSATTDRRLSLGGQTLALFDFTGTVELTATDDAEAALSFKTRARPGADATAAEALQGVRVRESTGGGQTRFTMEAPDDAGAQIDVRGTVPRGTPLELRLREGTVVLDGLAGPVTLRATTSTVVVRGGRGALTMDVDTGTLDVVLARLDGDIRLRTGTGTISVGLPDAASARVVASAMTGRVTLDSLTLAAPVRTPREGGERLTGTLGAALHRVEVFTLTGAVRLYRADLVVPDDF